MTSLQPHDLRMAINAGLDIAAQLAEAHASLHRIDRLLQLMRETYVANGDDRAVHLIDAIRGSVVAAELPHGPAQPEPTPAGVEMAAVGTRHPQERAS